MFRSRSISPYVVFVVMLVVAHTFTAGAQHSLIDVQLSGSLSAQGVFLLSEGAPSLKITVRSAQAGAAPRVTLQVLDHSGRERLYRAVSLGVGGTAELDLSQLPPGWYRVRYTLVGSDGLTELARGARDIAILRGQPELPAMYSPFGVANDRLQSEEAYLLRQMGAGWIWGGAVPSWAEAQVQPGSRLMWRTTAEGMEAARAAELVPAGNVGEVPLWARLSGLPSDPYLTEFPRFLRTLADELPGGAALSAVPLFDVVLDAHDRFAEAVKRIKVVTASLQDGGGRLNQILEAKSLTQHGLEQLLSHGVLDRIDAILLHMPSPVVQPEDADWTELERTRGYLRALGSGAALWTVTPNAANSKAEEESIAAVSLFGVPTPVETPYSDRLDTLIQAQWLVRSHVLQLAHGVERIFAAPFSTGPSDQRLFTGSAGAYPDLPQRPRPSVAAYATLAETLTGATYMGQLSMPFGIWAFVFAKQGEPILVVWTTRPSAVLELNNVNVPVVEVTDMMGARTEQPVVASRLVLPVSPSPQYVHGFDVGLLAQALLDQFRERLDLLRTLADWAERDVDSLADRVYSLATQLWIHAQDPSADVAELIPTWYETVDQMLQLGYSLVGSGRRAAGALYEVFELLAVLAELGAVMGIQDDPEELQAQVEGTDALLSDARAALSELTSREEVALPHAARLMERVQRWWQQSAHGSLQARAAWAVVAREAAALAMAQAFAEEPVVPHVFLLTDTTYLERPFPGFDVYEPGASAADVWNHIEQLLDAWLIPGGLGLGGLKGTQSVADGAAVDAKGWDVVPLTVKVVDMSGRGALFHVVLEGPEGWLWHVQDSGATIQPLGERVVVELPAAVEGATTVSLGIDLLIPHDAAVGLYDVVLTLYDARDLAADRIAFTVKVDDAPTHEEPADPQATPHGVEQLPTASPW